MGKKKKKRSGGTGMYDQKRNEQIADHLENYINDIQSLFILEGKSEKDVNDAIKVVKKAIKNLRDGKPEKVFDEERYEEFSDTDHINDFYED